LPGHSSFPTTLHDWLLTSTKLYYIITDRSKNPCHLCTKIFDFKELLHQCSHCHTLLRWHAISIICYKVAGHIGNVYNGSVNVIYKLRMLTMGPVCCGIQQRNCVWRHNVASSATITLAISYLFMIITYC